MLAVRFRLFRACSCATDSGRAQQRYAVSHVVAQLLSDRDIDILVQGEWLEMTARVGRGADQPDEVLPLLDEYLKRFPRAKASLGNGTLGDVVKRAVMVRCRLG